ncbi:MAG: hypothetical protein IKZ59_03710 [Clostridia bacterium]|nr:hypothetical protein [Clostridia bacterium]
MKSSIKRIGALLVCAVITTCLFTVSAANPLGGDINGDNAVNNKDLTRFFQYLSDWNVSVNTAVLDVNNDGKVNNKDLTRLFQYLSGWDVEVFPETICNHAVSEWVTTQEATTESPGQRQLICKRCGKALETEVIPVITMSKYEELEAGMLRLINEARAEEDLAPLTFDSARHPATDKRVQEITEVFSHTRPNGQAYYTALTELGLSYGYTCGENIAYFGYYDMNSDTTEGYTRLHNNFMNSESHKSNILNSSFTSVSLSFLISGGRLYVVQMFFG